MGGSCKGQRNVYLGKCGFKDRAGIRTHSRRKTWRTVGAISEVSHSAGVGADTLNPFRDNSTLEIGPIAGWIYSIILAVGCMFFYLLDVVMPRSAVDFSLPEMPNTNKQ